MKAIKDSEVRIERESSALLSREKRVREDERRARELERELGERERKVVEEEEESVEEAVEEKAEAVAVETAVARETVEKENKRELPTQTLHSPLRVQNQDNSKKAKHVVTPSSPIYLDINDVKAFLRGIDHRELGSTLVSFVGYATTLRLKKKNLFNNCLAISAYLLLPV